MSEFFLNEKNASKTRLKEAENARKIGQNSLPRTLRAVFHVATWLN